MSKFFKKLISSVLVALVITSISIPTFAESGETTINGDIPATVVSFSVPNNISYTLNPNGTTEAERFIAPDFTIQNTCNAPLKVEIMQFQAAADSTYIFADVLPDAYTDQVWAKLNRTDSNNIALAVIAKNSTEWRSITQTVPLYAKQVQTSGSTVIGEVDPHATTTFTLQAKHGNSFGQPETSKYKIVWVFSLA